MPHDFPTRLLADDLKVTLPAPGFLNLVNDTVGTAADEGDTVDAVISDLIANLPDPAEFQTVFDPLIADADAARQWVEYDEYPSSAADLDVIGGAMEAALQNVVQHQAGTLPGGEGIPTVGGDGTIDGVPLPVGGVDVATLQDSLVNAVTARVIAQLPPGGAPVGAAPGGGPVLTTPVQPRAGQLATHSQHGLMSIDNGGNVHWFLGPSLPLPVDILVSEDGGANQEFAREGQGEGSAPAPWLFTPGSVFVFTMIGSTGSEIDRMSVTGVGLAAF